MKDIHEIIKTALAVFNSGYIVKFKDDKEISERNIYIVGGNWDNRVGLDLTENNGVRVVMKGEDGEQDETIVYDPELRNKFHEAWDWVVESNER